jgi:hypothetical protein
VNIIQQLIELYQKHEKLSLVLLSLIGGWLLSKVVPGLYSLVVGLLNKLGRILGGRLAYKSIQNKYLNWVVLQNQDLNLTGIIGSGQKPRLEQVFISLKVLDESDDKQKSKDKLKTINIWIKFIGQRIWDDFITIIHLFKSLFNLIIPSKPVAGLIIFSSFADKNSKRNGFW